MRAPADVTYNTDYDTAWAAVAAAVHGRFHPEDFKSEDKDSGEMSTKWKAMASTATVEQDSTTSGRPQGLSGDFLQIRVRVSKESPIQVLVDGEGAHKSVDSPMLRPYARHGGDEPAWVDGRIEELRSDIYGRLKQYAVTSASSPAEPPKQ